MPIDGEKGMEGKSKENGGKQKGNVRMRVK